MNLSIEEAQKFFNTDLNELATMPQSEINYESQNHYGDFQVESFQDGDERARLS